MSTLGGLIRYTLNKSKSKYSKPSGWLSRSEWEKKLRKEGKWKNYG